MSNAVKAICGVFLVGVLLFGCSDDEGAGCENLEVFGDQCLDVGTCPDCGPVCDGDGGTSLGAPACVERVGLGLFCTCLCEFCVEE